MSTERIEFRVPAIPVAQPRPRATTVQGHTRMYEAKKEHPIHTFKAMARITAASVYKGPPLTGPLLAHLTFVFPSKTKRTRKPKATKPDCDNLAKGVLDCLNGLLFVDDGQVVELTVRKWHAAGDEQPHVLVCIEPLTEPAQAG